MERPGIDGTLPILAKALTISSSGSYLNQKSIGLPIVLSSNDRLHSYGYKLTDIVIHTISVLSWEGRGK